MTEKTKKVLMKLKDKILEQAKEAKSIVEARELWDEYDALDLLLTGSNATTKT